MSVKTLQVTLSGKTRVTSDRIPAYEVTFQNNDGNVAHVGDINVSASRGVALAANGAANSIWKFGPFPAYNINLEDFYIIGTDADVIDVVYVE